MSAPTNGPQPENREDFLREADTGRVGLAAEFWDFLKHNKKWWLVPILVTIVVVGVVAFMAASPAAAPFIYPLF
ncbi:MAG: DUF5989 family protein [Phycisphaerae bacterium]